MKDTQQVFIAQAEKKIYAVHLVTSSPDKFWTSKNIKNNPQIFACEKSSILPDFDTVHTNSYHFEETMPMTDG